MKVAVVTLGCKVNECESRSIITELRECGYDAFEGLEWADVFVLNTCSVTNEADRKSRQTVGKLQKLNPDAKIYICGCSSQRDCSAYEKYSNVVFVGGTSKKREVVQRIISDTVQANKIEVSDIPSYFEEMLSPSHERTRDFIKVQDGCNNFCSYCIIPYVRGRSRSRSIDSVLKEVNEAVKHTKEIVLTGIDISSYGKDNGSSLKELISNLGTFDVRKRMSSFECTIVNDDLLKALKDSNFCDHFHLSLQSGSDSVLKAMNRHYDTAKYREIVNLIRKYFPNAGITTDIITGFPTESEENFAETCNFVKEIGFSDIHVFPYSERKGTNAAKLKQLPMEERRRRAGILGDIKKTLKAEFLEKQIGKTLSVYFEELDENGLASGYAENYVRVYAKATPGEVKNIKIGELYKEGVKEYE